MAKGKTLQTSVEIAGVLSPSLQKAVNAAVDRLAEMSEETLASACAAEKLSAEISAQESVLKSLRKGYADYIVSGDKSSKEAKGLAKHIDKLSDELDENKASLRAAEKAANKLGNAAEDAGEQVEDSAEGYTVLKNVIANLITKALDKAAESFKQLATEGDSALGKLEARTGASAKQMEGYQDVLYEVYNANYGESLEAVGDTLSTVIQMTDDLDNASLAKLTKNAIALEDVFGFDVTESMRTANMLMERFGLTSEGAFNLIVQGAQNGLNKNDDLLDTLNEYAVHYQQLGLSADDMLNSLANGADTGAFSVDKLGDAVKEFGIRAMDDSDSTAEAFKDLGLNVEEMEDKFAAGGDTASKAFKETLERLGEVDNKVWQNQIGVALFGTMWEDLGAETVLALGKTEGAIDSANNAMEQMDTAAYDTLESSISQLGRTIESEAVQPIVEKLTPAIKASVKLITSKVGPAVDWLLDNLPTIGVALAGISATVLAFNFSKIISGIKGVGTALKALATGNPVGMVIMGVSLLMTGITYLWNHCEGFRNFWLNLWENIKVAASAAAEWLQGAWSSVTSFFSELWTGISTATSTAWEGITTTLSGIWTGISTTASTTWAAITDTLGGAISGIETVFNGLVDFITGVFSGNWSDAWNGVVTAFGGIWETLTGLVKAPINAVIGLVNKAITSLNKVSISIPDWVPGMGGQTWGIDIPTIPLLAAGGFTDGVSIAGEAGTEAVISFNPAYRDKNIGIWEKAGQLLGVLNSGAHGGGLISKAGELLGLNDFSLGSLADGGMVIYYDFSNFTWSPHIETGGSGEDEDSFMARLKAHEAEFFDWLEEFIKMREVAQYA